jgi:hypothetical protein
MKSGFLCTFLSLSLIFSGINKSFGQPGQLVSYSLVRSFPASELKAFFKSEHIPKVVLPVNKGINVYEVIYTTTYVDSSQVKASGLLFVPVITGKELPIMIYNHGTEMCKDRQCDFKEEQTIDLAFATDEYIVVAPDYVGMGKGDRNQVYLHAPTEAHASVDMLIASTQVLQQLNIKTNKQLFITGYSQGGHAAMATHRLLQQEYADRFPVTASSPMSGPYDVERTVYNARNGHFDYPAFFLLLMQGFYEKKHDPKDLAMVLNAPYDTLLPPLLNGSYEADDIDKLLPDTIAKVIKPEFYKPFDSDSNSDFRVYLRSNNVFDWSPNAPMQLCYCNNDEEVNYHNSIEAYNTMKKNGSEDVQLWRVGKKFGHVNCALFAVIYTKMFFDGFRDGHPGSHGPQFKRLLLTLGKMAVKER